MRSGLDEDLGAGAVGHVLTAGRDVVEAGGGVEDRLKLLAGWAATRSPATEPTRQAR
ncbi:hypothetical protein [Streptomyces sp. NPDC050704]|uniref:hypothetical protein n=1 Tax=Streptomyces sp. NPDC050704 TaxID=3157219 RepID=UPI003418C3FE